MDLHQRKTGRITLPGTDINVRSCIPAFYPAGKQSPIIQNKQLQVQDALIPIQHSSCSTQVFSFDQGPPPPPQMITHEAINQHQDIEYITLPVYKTRKNDPPPHFNQTEPAEGRFHQESNATLDLRTFQNLSYSPMPEPHPYFCLARPRNPIHQEIQKFMAFQPPPRSPCREPPARALISQHNTHYSHSEFEGKEDQLYYPKNFVMNMPGRRPAADIQLPIPFQWVEVNKQKMNQNAVMKTIQEKVEGNFNIHQPFRRCQNYEVIQEKPEMMDKNIFVQRNCDSYDQNKKMMVDTSVKKKCAHNGKDSALKAFPGNFFF